MTFDYKKSFNQDHEKWDQFDNFLSELSSQYPEEFQKEIYTNKRFMAIGYKSNPADIVYAFDGSVPDYIQNLILKKLHQLFN